MMENLEIDIFHPLYTGFEHIIDFWADSIKRINQLNANMLSESVLLYTMSFINNKQEDITLKQDSDNLFEMIVEYVDGHYKETDMSLKKLTGMFPYSEKYLSFLFKKKMNVGFNKYLNGLRIQYANELIGKNKNSVSEIAALCGYVDPLYFSKVFKRKYGISPMQHIKDVTENRKEDALDYTRL